LREVIFDTAFRARWLATASWRAADDGQRRERGSSAASLFSARRAQCPVASLHAIPLQGKRSTRPKNAGRVELRRSRMKVASGLRQIASRRRARSDSRPPPTSHRRCAAARRSSAVHCSLRRPHILECMDAARRASFFFPPSLLCGNPFPPHPSSSPSLCEVSTPLPSSSADFPPSSATTPSETCADLSTQPGVVRPLRGRDFAPRGQHERIPSVEMGRAVAPAPDACRPPAARHSPASGPNRPPSLLTSLPLSLSLLSLAVRALLAGRREHGAELLLAPRQLGAHGLARPLGLEPLGQQPRRLRARRRPQLDGRRPLPEPDQPRPDDPSLRLDRI
jgi:hypothetical protein